MILPNVESAKNQWAWNAPEKQPAPAPHAQHNEEVRVGCAFPLHLPVQVASEGEVQVQATTEDISASGFLFLSDHEFAAKRGWNSLNSDAGGHYGNSHGCGGAWECTCGTLLQKRADELYCRGNLTIILCKPPLSPMPAFSKDESRAGLEAQQALTQARTPNP